MNTASSGCNKDYWVYKMVHGTKSTVRCRLHTCQVGDPTECVANGYLRPDLPITFWSGQVLKQPTQYSAGVLDAGHSDVTLCLNTITLREQRNYIDCTVQQ